jgi:3-oxoacyl-[acyl-carrier protein] reductase
VNNAGFTWDGMLHKMTDQQWEKILDVHVSAPFRMIRAATPYMREAGKKDISAGGVPKDRCMINEILNKSVP